MGHAFLNRRYLEIASKLLDWAAREYTTEGKLKRPENAVSSTVVCPFLKPSLDTDHFQIAIHPEVNGADPGMIQQLMHGYISIFKRMPPFHEENKKALLVVFPNIDDRNVSVLDHVHSGIKSKFVQAALMIAQFHKKCDARSIHDKNLKTQICEYPLMAIRHMQRHDILFLKDDAEWFMDYNKFFGDKFALEKENDYYYDLYQSAKKKHFQPQ